MAERERPPEGPKPLKKRVLGLERAPTRDRASFLKELQRAARGRLDKRSPDK